MVKGSDPRMGPTWPYSENVSSFVLPYIFVKKLMHISDVHESLFLSFIIHGPSSGVQALGVKLILPYSGNALILRNIFLLRHIVCL